MTVQAGTKLGPYELTALIGAGGMGEVYRAHDPRLHRDVAVKIIRARFAGDAARVRRFEQEARAAASLNHPNVLSVYDLGTTDGCPYIVSELLQGETLRERLQSGPLAVRKAIDYAQQVARGLAAAHDQGVVHRDLKPENVFITADGRVKILDFGLAKLTRPEIGDDVQTLTRAPDSEPGTVLGTVGYMSPEQVRGKPADTRSDLFSFGAILYEMLSGTRAFQGESPAETMSAIVKQEPAELAATNNAIPPVLDRLVRRCLEKEPRDRFQSSHDLGFALDTLSASGSGAPVAVVTSTGTRRRWLMTALGAGLAVLAAVVAFLAGARVFRTAVPVFSALPAGPGYVSAARFTPDGHSVVYGAAWNGKPIELFETSLGRLGSRSLGLPPADIAGIARNGDIGLLLGRHSLFQWVSVGTLARAPLGGAAPRPLLDNVCDADIKADGTEFALVRCSRSGQTLEFPQGHVLYRTSGYVDHVRISPDGQTVAFADHPIAGDDRGSVSLVGPDGRVRRLTGEYSSLAGVAWAPGGQQLWFSATGGDEDFRSLRAVSLSGTERLLFAGPGDIDIEDVSQDGKALLTNTRQTSEIAVHVTNLPADRLLELPGDAPNNVLSGISADGKTVVITNTGIGSGVDYLTQFTSVEKVLPVVLGEGDACGISPDGKWVVSFLPSAPSKFTVYPTGTGETRSFDLAPVRNVGIYCSWTADGTKAVFTGSEPGKASRAYMLDVQRRTARAVTPEGTSDALISPDGGHTLARSGDTFFLYPIAGGEPLAPRGLAPDEFPVSWHESGRKVFVWNRQFPATVVLLDVFTGERKTWMTIDPPNKVGLAWGTMILTPDGNTCAYRYRRLLNILSVTKGLR